MENERIRILLERQKEQILAEVRSEIHKHENQADSDRRSIQELTEIIESQRREIDLSHVTSQPAFFPPFRDAKRSWENAEQQW